MKDRENKTPYFYSQKKTLILSIILIVLAGLLVYANSLQGQFLWDDVLLIRDNAYISDFSSLGRVFIQDLGQGADSEYNFYRPLQMVSYMCDQALYGLNPKGYHLTSIILHILTAVCLYFFIFMLFKDQALSLIAGLLFVVHPLHTEVVSYISGRADSLAAIFVLLSIIFYVRASGSKKLSWAFLAVVSFILALLCRENSLILPAAILMLSYVFRRKIDLRTFVCLMVIAGFYIILRLTLLKYLLTDISSHPLTLFQRIPGVFAAITDYIRLMVLPFDLHMEYGDAIFSWADPKVILGIVITAASLFFIFRRSNKNILLCLGIGWFFVFLMPHLNIYPLSAYMAEHWLYLPSLGLFLIIARLFTYIVKDKGLKALGLIGLLCLLAYFSFLTIEQNSYWRSPADFYERTLKYAPQSARIHYNLGRAYYDQDKYQEATGSYKKAIECDPRYVKAYYNLGIVYYHTGQKEESINTFYQAVDIDPGYVKAYYNLGNALGDIGRNEEAIKAYKKAIEHDPGYAKAYNNLGIVYHGLGRFKEAIEIFNKAIELRVGYAETHYNLANTLSALGRKDEAVAEYEKAIGLKPDYADAYNNLGIAYYDMQKYQEAILAYKKAFALDPGYADVYNNLGNAYKAQGQRRQALSAYKKTVEVDPDHAMAHNNLAVTYYYDQRYDLAVEYCDKAIELGYPVHPKFLELLAPHRE